MDPIKQIEEHEQRVSAMFNGPVIHGQDALEYLQAVYRDPLQSTYTRLKAAIAALPFERPKLQATAVTHLTGKDFATMLERARVAQYEVERQRLAIEEKVGEKKSITGQSL